MVRPGDEITLYRNGPFVDLCRGPHVPSTSCLDAGGVQLLTTRCVPCSACSALLALFALLALLCSWVRVLRLESSAALFSNLL